MAFIDKHRVGEALHQSFLSYRTKSHPDGRCACGWYCVRYASCSHHYSREPFHCGAKVSKTGRVVFCRTPAPERNIVARMKPEYICSDRDCKSRVGRSPSGRSNPNIDKPGGPSSSAAGPRSPRNEGDQTAGQAGDSKSIGGGSNVNRTRQSNYPSGFLEPPRTYERAAGAGFSGGGAAASGSVRPVPGQPHQPQPRSPVGQRHQQR